MRRYLRLRELVWVGGCVTAPVAWPSPPGGDAGVYTDRWKWPLDAVLGHLCTLLRREDRSSGRGDAGVYTDWHKWTLDAVSGHLCTLLRRCGQPWVCKSVHRLAKMASRRRFGAFVYTVATRFAEASTHTNPRRAKDVPGLEKSTRSASGPLRARQAAFELVHQQPDVVHGGLRLGVQV